MPIPSTDVIWKESITSLSMDPTGRLFHKQKVLQSLVDSPQNDTLQSYLPILLEFLYSSGQILAGHPYRQAIVH